MKSEIFLIGEVNFFKESSFERNRRKFSDDALLPVAFLKKLEV